MHHTPYPDVNRMIELIQARVQETLRERLVGLYLSGSLVTGDFDLAVSDVDLVAVTSSDLMPAEIARLEAMHRAIARQEKTWDNRIEVIYITADALRTFRIQPSTIAIISPGEPFHTRAADKDWLVNWYVLREAGGLVQRSARSRSDTSRDGAIRQRRRRSHRRESVTGQSTRR